MQFYRVLVLIVFAALSVATSPPRNQTIFKEVDSARGLRMDFEGGDTCACHGKGTGDFYTRLAVLKISKPGVQTVNYFEHTIDVSGKSDGKRAKTRSSIRKVSKTITKSGKIPLGCTVVKSAQGTCTIVKKFSFVERLPQRESGLRKL